MINTTCCICGQVFDDHKRLPKEYAIHGRGKNKVVNYFHYSCYYRELKELRKKVYDDINF